LHYVKPALKSTSWRSLASTLCSLMRSSRSKLSKRPPGRNDGVPHPGRLCGRGSPEAPF
jgi:hypothetical protein